VRKLFAALTKLAFADGNVLGKYPNYRSTKGRPFVEKARSRLFDLLSQSKKLRDASAAFRALRSGERVQRGIADLTQHDLLIVQHRKPEGPSILVVSFDSMANQRHGLHSPQTGTPPRLRVHQPASQINNFGSQPLRKLSYALIALASIAFGGVLAGIGAYGRQLRGCIDKCNDSTALARAEQIIAIRVGPV
jgi:hypothetical protein